MRRSPLSPTQNVLVERRGKRLMWAVSFRDDTGRQTKRQLGPAWVALVGDPQAKPNGATFNGGKFVQRRGHVKDGFLDYATAVRHASEVLVAHWETRAEEQHVAKLAETEASRPRSFRELSADWRATLVAKGRKPSTLSGYDVLLSEPGVDHRRGSGVTRGHIMEALGDKPANAVTVADCERLFAKLSATGASPRTIEYYRAVVRAIFNHGIRRSERFQTDGDGQTYGLAINPAKLADVPRPKMREPLKFYRPEEVEALALRLPAAFIAPA